MRQLRIDRSFTPKNEAALTRYYAELDRLPLITAEEEVLLAQRIRQGDRAALHRLVTANLRFVVSVANKYSQMGMPFSDLIAEGNIGLMKAAKLFDETKGFRFISYAVWWVRLAMTTALANHLRMIRLPANMGRTITQLREAHDRLEQQLERKPSDSELAAWVATYDPRERAYLHLFCRSTPSLDMPLGDEGGTLLEFLADADSPSPEAELESHDRRQFLQRCLGLLQPLERQILESCYGLDVIGRERSSTEVAEQLGMNKETLRQMRKRSIAKIQLAIEKGKVRL